MISAVDATTATPMPFDAASQAATAAEDGDPFAALLAALVGQPVRATAGGAAGPECSGAIDQKTEAEGHEASGDGANGAASVVLLMQLLSPEPAIETASTAAGAGTAAAGAGTTAAAATTASDATAYPRGSSVAAPPAISPFDGEAAGPAIPGDAAADSASMSQAPADHAGVILAAMASGDDTAQRATASDAQGQPSIATATTPDSAQPNDHPSGKPDEPRATPPPATPAMSPGNPADPSARQESDGDQPPRARREVDGKAEPIAHVADSAATATTPLRRPESATAPEGAVRAEPRRVIHEVASAVARRAEEGGGDIRLRLDPPELGHVDLHVRMHDGGVAVELRAERPDAARLLQDHHDQLASLLSQQGLDLTGLHVSVGGGGSQPNHGEEPARREQRPRDGEFASLLGIEPAAAAHTRLRAAYNPDGLHLFRV